MMTCTLNSLIVLAIALLQSVNAGALTKDYCIVGAGPSGLQLGSFLQQSQRDYIIFERGNFSGKELHCNKSCLVV